MESWASQIELLRSFSLKGWAFTPLDGQTPFQTWISAQFTSCCVLNIYQLPSYCLTWNLKMIEQGTLTGRFFLWKLKISFSGYMLTFGRQTLVRQPYLSTSQSSPLPWCFLPKQHPGWSRTWQRRYWPQMIRKTAFCGHRTDNSCPTKCLPLEAAISNYSARAGQPRCGFCAMKQLVV